MVQMVNGGARPKKLTTFLSGCFLSMVSARSSFGLYLQVSCESTLKKTHIFLKHQCVLRGAVPPQKDNHFIHLQFPYPTHPRSSFSDNMIDSKGAVSTAWAMGSNDEHQKIPGWLFCMGDYNCDMAIASSMVII